MAKYCRTVPKNPSKPPSGINEPGSSQTPPKPTPASSQSASKPTPAANIADRVRNLFQEYNVELSEGKLQDIFKVVQKTSDDDVVMNEGIA